MRQETGRKSNKTVIRLVAVLVLLAALIAAGFLTSRFSLTVTRYEVSAGFSEPVRAVLLTDQHTWSFGKDNARLLEKVAGEEPDLIFIAGDQINQDSGEEEVEEARAFVSALSEIAPVYFSYGNHEAAWDEAHGTLAEAFASAGAHVVEYSWEDVEVNGQELRIGGIYGYCLPPELLESGEARAAECAFLEDFQDTDRYTMLLCHMPVCWMINGSLDAWEVDTVLAGHIHGGQIVLPLIGGVYAPDLGMFPGRCRGIWQSQDGQKTLVVSAGLGSYDKLPRFNNVPEIVTVDFE